MEAPRIAIGKGSQRLAKRNAMVPATDAASGAPQAHRLSGSEQVEGTRTPERSRTAGDDVGPDVRENEGWEGHLVAERPHRRPERGEFADPVHGHREIRSAAKLSLTDHLPKQVDAVERDAEPAEEAPPVTEVLPGASGSQR